MGGLCNRRLGLDSFKYDSISTFDLNMGASFPYFSVTDF